MPTELPTRYDAASTEERIYQGWESKGLFTADPASTKPPYCIVIPPPNVTGSLHMGHALNNTLQDIVIRWRRMNGHEVLWLPGTDHAGIATQNVVERELAKDKVSRHDLGREKFLERVWEWKQKYGDTIIRQLKRLGCSCDWTRCRFTMDEGYSHAIRVAFVRYFEKGYIYKDKRIVNWCPRCLSAISDIEVDRPEKPPKGKLWHIKYPVKGSDRFLTVATTRPETMLGDTAVAVHPDDPRYQDLIGKTAVLPLMDREIPIIADGILVDPKFGTGAVKVTPAHDQSDFDCGVRNKLPRVIVMDEHGAMNENAGKYRGLDRFKARDAIVKDLEALGLLIKTQDHETPIGYCDRCKTVLEPYLSDQWFVRMKELAQPAIRVVKEGRVRFIPDRWTRVYLEWMENLRDWCISRQIWWGHRVPAWKCADCKKYTTGLTDPTKCGQCGSAKIEQETDVLDTWFSSALWPFATLGWPDKAADVAKFYPGHSLFTASEIIYLWVARMIFSGMEFLGEIPFSDVYIHATVKIWGDRMSKSKGNGVDPLELIKRYGADATRHCLASQANLGQDLNWQNGFKNLGEAKKSPPDDPKWTGNPKCEEGQAFITKIWNACRFSLSNVQSSTPARLLDALPTSDKLAFEDRWILSRLHTCIAKADAALEEYRFGEYVGALYHFVWHEFCDWYLEIVKPRLGGPDRATVEAVLVQTLTNVLRLLHPVIPFVTEELWQAIRSFPGLDKALSENLMTAPWPKQDPSRVHGATEEAMSRLMDVTRGIREIRARVNAPRAQLLAAQVSGQDEAALAALRGQERVIERLGGLSALTLGVGLSRPPRSATEAIGPLAISVPLEGVIDLAAERKRLEQRLAETVGGIERVQKKLGDPNFRDKAPAEVVQAEETRMRELEAQRAKLEEAVRDLA